MSDTTPSTTNVAVGGSYKKRKRIVLNIKEKCDILKKLKNGESVTSIANQYDVCRSTIWGIKQSEKKILNFSSQIGAAIYLRKTMKKSEDYNLDAAVYTWFKTKTDEGAALSNQMICEEALRLNREFNGDLNFKATRGWLRRFKARHDITNQNVISTSKHRSMDELTVDTDDSLVVTPVKIPVTKKKSDNNNLMDENGTQSEWEIADEERPDSVIPTANIKEEEPAEIIDDDNDQNEVQEMTDEEIPKPTAEEAFNAIDTVIQWAELQREVNIEQLMFLRTLQSVAAKKALASISRRK